MPTHNTRLPPFKIKYKETNVGRVVRQFRARYQELCHTCRETTNKSWENQTHFLNSG